MAIILTLLSLYYVDQPFPKAPEHGVFDLQLRFGPAGAITGYFNVGIWDRLGLGLSYGGSNLLGSGSPEFYEIPGVQIRLQAIGEGAFYPQIQLGFDNQGYGNYDERYDIRSKGIYCQINKTFFVPNLEVHPSLGMNYCFESDGGVDIFGGIEFVFGSISALLVDYAPNFNDPEDEDKGYLNVGLRLIFYGEMFFEFSLRDLLGNSPDDEQLNRMIKMGFEQAF